MGACFAEEVQWDPFHIQHALTVETVMKWFANELGYGDEANTGDVDCFMISILIVRTSTA